MTIRLGLSDSALQERRAGIGGSDARIVCHGTPEERYELWQIKVGEKKPKKIMSDWAYALRYATETLQLDWYEHEHPGVRITRRGDVAISQEHGFMRCTLDGMLEADRVPINCKHVSRWTKEAREWCLDHYTPQITHEALVLGSSYGLLSLLHGEKEPEIIRIDVDPWYSIEMIEAERKFWHSCVEGVPPEDCLVLDTPKVAIPQPRRRSLSIDTHLFGTPEWAELCRRANWAPDIANEALTFAETDGATKRHFAAREAIKKLLPEDVGLLDIATAKGIVDIKQDGRGVTITMREKADV